jgi:hypothetical protein
VYVYQPLGWRSISHDGHLHCPHSSVCSHPMDCLPSFSILNQPVLFEIEGYRHSGCFGKRGLGVMIPCFEVMCVS